MTIFITFALAGLGTYLIRVAPLLAGEQLVSSPAVERHVGLIAPAVLAAIVCNALAVGPSGAALPGLVELAAIWGAFAIVRRTGNVGFALAVGFPIYWIGMLAGLA